MGKERKDQKQQFIVILTITFLGFLGISIPYLIFPPLFLNPEYSFLPGSWETSTRALFLGVTLAVYPLGQFIGSPILGALSDDYGRKNLLSTSLIFTAICNLLIGIAIAKQHLALLIIGRFLAGLMEGNVAIARAMCADLKLLSKHKTFGTINAAASIAFIIGPFLGGLLTDKTLYEALTTSTPFFATSIVFFLLTPLSALLLKEPKILNSLKSQTVWERFNFIKRLSNLFSNKNLKKLIITSTLYTLAVDILYEFGPVYLTVKWIIGPAELLLYNGLLCIGLALSNGWLSGFIASRVSQPFTITCSMIAFIFLLLGLICTNAPLFMLIWFGLLGIFIGISTNFLTVKISDTASNSMQGEVMGTQLSLRVLGDSLICLFGGALLILSAKVILAIAAAIALGAIIYYMQAKV